VSVEFSPTGTDITETDEEIAEADVLISARKNVIQSLMLRGVVDVYSRKVVTANRLCFTTSADNPLKLILIPRLPLAGILRKLDPEFYFVLGDPMWQRSGVFALQALRNYEMAGDLEPHFLFMRNTADAQGELAKAGAYGVIYCSDAQRNPTLGVRGIFDAESHDPILYEAVSIAGEEMEAARGFIDWLAGEEAQAVFRRYHFAELPEEKKAVAPAENQEASGQRARGSVVKGEVSPASNRSRAAIAIIAALSVHSFTGGKTQCVSSSSASASIAPRMALLAATPPASTIGMFCAAMR
jgi:molybdate transport system substrate-binding protein